MVKVALVVSIIALAVCLLTALHGVLSDGLKGLKQRSNPCFNGRFCYATYNTNKTHKIYWSASSSP